MPTIDVKQAVDAAQKFLLQLFPGAKFVRLEEVELMDETPTSWHVTLSYVLPDTDPLMPATALSQMLGDRGGYPRHYKMFVIDASSGDARAMKIRKM